MSVTSVHRVTWYLVETLILDRIEDALGDLLGRDETLDIVMFPLEYASSSAASTSPLRSTFRRIHWAIGGLRYIEDQVHDIAGGLPGCVHGGSSMVEREAERSELHEDKAKVDGQIQDSLPGDVSLRIIGAGRGFGARNGCQGRRQPGGRAVVWLGLGPGERSRVQVLLDGAAVALSRFEVEELLPFSLTLLGRDRAREKNIFIARGLSVRVPPETSGVRLTREATSATNRIHGREVPVSWAPSGGCRRVEGRAQKSTRWAKAPSTRRDAAAVSARPRPNGTIGEGTDRSAHSDG